MLALLALYVIPHRIGPPGFHDRRNARKIFGILTRIVVG